MNKLFTPFRVGLLVILSAAVLVFFLTFVKKGGLSKSESLSAFAYFRDASGLSAKSRVQIAGIQVGEIEKIELENGRAKVFLRIRRSVGLHQDAALRKRSESLLGDYMLDLVPGSEGSPLMESGGEITRVIDAQGMEQVFESLGKITGDIETVTSSLRKVLGGDKGAGSMETIVDNMVKLSTQLETTMNKSAGQLDGILGNVAAISSDVRGMTASEQRSVRDIIQNIDDATKDVKQVLESVKGVIGNNEGDLKDSVSGLKQTLGRLDKTLANLEDITGKVKDGKGMVGTLLADERAGQKLSETVEDVSDFASRLTRLQIEASIKAEYLFSQGTSKDTFGIRIMPRPDKYYLIELVDDPRGSVTTQTIQTNPPNAGQPATQVQTITGSALKFTAQFAKRFYFLTLRFGITENTGGVGADLHLLNDMLSLKVDAFNFSVQNLQYPRLRGTLRFQAFDHLFATAGMDDILNRPTRDLFTNRLVAGRDIFLGGGVYFTDEDLKSVLVAVPIPKP